MKKQYPYTPKTIRTNTGFAQKWGMTAAELAREEGVSTATIHMRVMNFGTPFQRKNAPTVIEILTGKTAYELAIDQGVTPFSIAQRLRLYGDATYINEDCPGAASTRGTTKAEKHWTETKQGGKHVGSKHGWLHPKHPDFLNWRYKYILKYCPSTCDSKAEEK